MRKRILHFLANFAMRVVWSIGVSILVSLCIIAFAVCTGATQTGLWEIIKQSLPAMLLVFFVPSFSLLFAKYLISMAGQASTPKFWLDAGKKARSIEKDTRLLVSNFSKWMGVCLVLIGLVFMILHLNEVHVRISTSNRFPFDITLLFSYFLPLLSGFSLIGAAQFLMNPYDWTIHYLQKFLQDKDIADMDRALRTYNRVIGSSLSLKKLLSISQWVSEAHKIGNNKVSENLDSRIHNVIKSLESRNIAEANNRLISLSKYAMELIKEHKETLGFEVSYPLKLRILEQFRGSLSKIFTQFMLFLLWLAFVVVLASLGIIPTPPPI